MLESESVTLCELLEARMFLEVPLAGLAAERSDEATIAALTEAIEDAVGRDPAGDEFRLADARFHQTIAVTAGNDLLVTFTSWILDVLQPSLIEHLGRCDRRRSDHRPAPGDRAGDPPPPAERGRARDAHSTSSTWPPCCGASTPRLSVVARRG